MWRHSLLICLTMAPAARPEVVLPAARQAHVLILQQVYLNGVGPLRMMVDTGNASSVVRPSVARRLGLRASGTVERVAASGTTVVPLTLLREVRVGESVDAPVEAMIADPGLSGIDGTLGQSWLERHDYVVDFMRRRIVLDGRPPWGRRFSLQSSEGVPEIAVEIAGTRRVLTVDSGAPALVLFGRPAPVQPVLSVADHRVAAVWLEGSGRSGGLLPVCAFDAVYVSNREGFVVIAGKGGVQ